MEAGDAYKPARAGFVDDAYTPANESADSVSLNIAVPVRSVSDMRDNPKILNRSGVYIYNMLTSLAKILNRSGVYIYNMLTSLALTSLMNSRSWRLDADVRLSASSRAAFETMRVLYVGMMIGDVMNSSLSERVPVETRHIWMMLAMNDDDDDDDDGTGQRSYL